MTDRAEVLRARALALRSQAAAAEKAARAHERAADTLRRILVGSWLLKRQGATLDTWPERLRADFLAFMSDAGPRERAAWRLDAPPATPPAQAEQPAQPAEAEPPGAAGP